MKLFSTLLLLLTFLFNLNAQKLITEKVISAFEEVEMVEYLAPGFFAVAAYNYSGCGSSSVTFVKSGEIIAKHSFFEAFVKEIKVRGDSIAITTLTYPGDLLTVKGTKISYFDKNGQFLSSSQGSIHNKNWERIEDLIAADAGDAVLIADMTGQLHYNSKGMDEAYPIVHPLPIIPTKPLFLIEAPEYQSSFDRKYYITAFKDLLLAGTIYDYFNEQLSVLELVDIQYVKYTGFNQILVIHGNQISIFDLHLQEIQSFALSINAQSWSSFGIHLLGKTDLGSAAFDPDVKMLEVTRIQTTDFTIVSKDTILHTLNDFESVGYRDSIFIIGLSSDMKQVVWDQFDLSIKGSDTFMRHDIGMTLELRNPVLKNGVFNYSLVSDAIVRVTNYGTKQIKDVLVYNFSKNSPYCGSGYYRNYELNLKPFEIKEIEIQITSEVCRITDNGDSLLFLIPCVWVFPYQDLYDKKVSNNSFCDDFKIKTPATAMQLLNSPSLNWHIYPNPVSDKLYLDTDSWPDSPVQLQLWNTQGIRIFQQNFDFPPKSISVSDNHMPPGLYWLRAFDTKSGKSYGTKSFLKQ